MRLLILTNKFQKYLNLIKQYPNILFKITILARGNFRYYKDDLVPNVLVQTFIDDVLGLKDIAIILDYAKLHDCIIIDAKNLGNNADTLRAIDSIMKRTDIPVYNNFKQLLKTSNSKF